MDSSTPDSRAAHLRRVDRALKKLIGSKPVLHKDALA